LGIEAGAAYTAGEHQLHPGDTLVLYTDGITEARGPAGRMYGEARLGAAVASCPHKAGPQATAQCQLDAILQDVESFAAGFPATDDRTIVVGRVR
jgi:sigma-B regulation protein RsbU (phosphoserine phosphatase)